MAFPLPPLPTPPLAFVCTGPSVGWDPLCNGAHTIALIAAALFAAVAAGIAGWRNLAGVHVSLRVLVVVGMALGALVAVVWFGMRAG